MNFQLDPQFEKDSDAVCDLPLCHVRINHNAAFPWIILIPRVADAIEIIDLEEAQQEQLLREIRAASHAMRAIYKADKLNVANLGNVVAQLHVHVIARFKNDPAWPRPIWNSGHDKAYAEDALQAEKLKIAAALKDYLP